MKVFEIEVLSTKLTEKMFEFVTDKTQEAAASTSIAKAKT